MRERSPCCSSAWNALRPVGLIRSPITQNGRPAPITTVLDGDSRTVSTHFPLLTGSETEAAAEARDAGLLAKADQVQAAHPRQAAGGVGALAALDHVGGHAGAGHLLVDEAKRLRRADEADRREDRGLPREPGGGGLRH